MPYVCLMSFSVDPNLIPAFVDMSLFNTKKLHTAIFSRPVQIIILFDSFCLKVKTNPPGPPARGLSFVGSPYMAIISEIFLPM